MKQKGEAIRSGRLLKYVLLGLLLFLGFVCLYNGSLFSGGLPRGDDSFGDDGVDPVTGRFETKRDIGELFDDEERNPEVPQSLPVCDLKYSELIPCLDRNLIYQMRLKVNLSLMEHYERHCPPPERRYNCRIPPPAGYKIPIRWPMSRDHVWKANIPHTATHILQMKNWIRIGWSWMGRRSSSLGEELIFILELTNTLRLLQGC